VRRVSTPIVAVGRGLWDYGLAILSVVGIVSLGVWVIEVFEEGRHPFNFWAVLVLAIALAAALLWGVQGRGSRPIAQGTHIYNAPVTINQPVPGFMPPEAQGQPAPSAPNRVIEGTPDSYRVVHPWDLMETVPHQGPIIFGYTFRYVVLEGPALIGLLGPGDMNDVTFGVTNNDIESILWDFGELDRARLGPIAVQNCNFEHCRFESIGITGHPDMLDKIRQFKQAPTGEPDASPHRD
jgi:hypothetical protein